MWPHPELAQAPILTWKMLCSCEEEQHQAQLHLLMQDFASALHFDTQDLTEPPPLEGHASMHFVWAALHAPMHSPLVGFSGAIGSSAKAGATQSQPPTSTARTASITRFRSIPCCPLSVARPE